MPYADPEARRAYQRRYRQEVKAGTRSRVTRRSPEDQAEHRRLASYDYRQTRYAKFKQILEDAKSKPCIDCGVQLAPACMDLDHVRGEKFFSPSQAINARLRPEFTNRLEMLLAEVAKCDVRCPNCHRLRHHRERF